MVELRSPKPLTWVRFLQRPHMENRLKFKMNKLVRDKVLPSFIERGDSADSRSLSTEELKKALIEKFTEEVAEAAEQLDNPEELLQELSDIEEIVIALLEASNLTREQLEEARKEKATRKGTYQSRTFIETAFLRLDSKWVEYFRKKYPEIKE